MDRKLFTEELLCRNIPRRVMELIEEIDAEIDPSVLDQIHGSPEVGMFVESLRAPRVAEDEKASVLLDNIKNKCLLKTEKSRRGPKKGARG